MAAVVCMRSQRLRAVGAASWQVLAVAAVYYGGAKLGLLQQLVRGQVTPFWPPTGIAVAALLLLGSRVWPGIALGALLVNAWIGPTPAAVAQIVAGNTLAPVCAYLLLRRAGFHLELDRLHDATALVFLGALVPTLISATVGSGALMTAGALPAGGFWPTWSVWWTGDTTGVLLVTPILLLLRRARLPRDVRLSRWAEAAALLVGTLGVALVTTTTSVNLLFLVFPFLLWAAFRFGLAGAAPCALLVSTIAIIGGGRRTGPFAGHDLFRDMVTLQAFNGSVALTALLVSALITERKRTYQELVQICGDLTELVTHLGLAEDPREWPGPRNERPEDDDSR